MGASELALRLPGLVAGISLVALTGALARALYGTQTMLLSAALVALAPFAVLFSGTAFPDLPMVALGLAGALAAALDRPGWAGVWLGLSFAAKQTGVMWLPVVVWLLLQQDAPRGRTFGRLALTGALAAGVVFAWDAARTVQGAGSFWQAGVTGYGGLRLIWPQELWPRLRDWAGLARNLFGFPVVTAVAIFGLPVLAWRGVRPSGRARCGLSDLLIAAFCMVYLLLHWLWAFPVWDRYLLPLVPMLSLGLGRLLLWLASSLPWLRTRATPVLLAAVVLLLALPGLAASRSAYPVGADHRLYGGIDHVAAFLQQLPEGAVVYQHWLGWHLAFYLFDAPVYQAYWPTPAWLARDVQVFGQREPRYIVWPSWEAPQRVIQALAEVGYRLKEEFAATRRDGTRSFTVYQIVPQVNP